LSHRELVDGIISARHAPPLVADLQPPPVSRWLTPAASADRDTRIADVFTV
jgi:hypothetical protein